MGSFGVFVLLLIGVTGMVILAAGCTGPAPAPPATSDATGLVVLSDSFSTGGTIPRQFTCQGESVSFPLSWSGVPPGTQTIAVLMQDVDTPRSGFTHWILYNIPPGSRGIPGNITTELVLPDGSVQGRNDAGKIGYTGPCPPAGNPHRYIITVYALNRSLDGAQALNRSEFDTAINGAVIGQGNLSGTYQRSLF
ncbi:MAG TPA: YbhB/YbcL family Raf kinase inhibitor-like protein [Methanoregulaceae archaeon]|nr:YbhB/YbcL family Raf kinase inhibitor-like protein [Methanoregulaceae archaeon]